jgi:esterase/lipase superfamily enzyme
MLRLQMMLSLVLCLAIAPAAAQEATHSRDAAERLRRPLATEHIQAAAEPDPAAVRAPARIKHPKSLGRTARQPADSQTSETASDEKPRTKRPQTLAAVLEALGATEPYDVSVSGRYVVATGDAGLLLADARQGRQLRTLKDSLRGYRLVKISGDARWIAAVRADDPDSIDLWRADNGKLIRTIIATGGTKSSIEFTATDELRVSTSSGNGMVYSVPGGEEVGGFRSATGGSGFAPGIGSAGPRAMVRKDASSPPLGNPIRPQRATPRAQAPPSVTMSAPRPRAASPKTEEEASIDSPPTMAPMAAAPMDAEPLGSGAPLEEPMTAAPMAAAPSAVEPTTPAPMMPVPSAMAPAPSARSVPRDGAPIAPMESTEPPSAAPMAAAPEESAPEASSAPMSAAPRSRTGGPRAIFRSEAEMEPSGGAAPEAASAPGSSAPQDFAPAESAPDAASPAAEPFTAAPPENADTNAAPPATTAQLKATAAVQPPPPPEEDLSNVTVHFATNRNRLNATDREWMVYFQSFFFSLPAFVIYALIVVSLLVFPWLGKRSWAAAALVTGIILLVSMASFEGYVRSQLRDELSGELYGSRPTELSYGACQISVPKPENRSAGELNRPLSVWVFEAPENAEKHFVLRKVDEHASKEAFYKSLSAQLERSQDGASLLFIHGYNVSFEDAIFRTAQLAVDLKFRGAPISFSWPSYADPVKYTFDEQNAEVSIPALREVLEDLATRSGAKRIHIVAHSMGNRVLAGALRSMSPEARVKNKSLFREIVLAAPDIDSRVFQSQVLPHIIDNTQHCTLYASSHDRALLLSRYFHNYQRLGETQPQLIVADGMDTIDASLVDTSLLGHSYIGDVKSIVTDLHDLVVSGKRPIERGGLESELLGELIYWAIKPQMQTASDPETRR